MSDLVSLCIVTYNRKKLLEMCIESFIRTNVHDNVEIALIDNGCTDQEAVDYIKYLVNKRIPEAGMKSAYYSVEKNEYPIGMKEGKNIVRKIATGDYYIDSPDDHLFVVKTDWIQQSIDHMKKYRQAGCVTHYAYPEYRFAKQNNKMHRMSGIPYFESELKGYADYNIMSKDLYEKLGPFKPELGLKTEGEYMDRALKAGYFRHMREYPVAIVNEFKKDPNIVLSELNLKVMWSNQRHPMSNEALTRVVLNHEKKQQ